MTVQAPVVVAAARPSPFPRAPLIGIGSLLAATIVAVAAVRATGIGASHTIDAPAAAVHDFRFEDRANGSIVVLDPASGRVVETIAPESNGFLRGTMRGLARERKRQGIGSELPFRIVGHTDGRLTLDDPGTGRHVDLGAFGPTNAAVFARIMSRAEQRPPATTARAGANP
jgi:putative photosynthetic complex assembly protein